MKRKIMAILMIAALAASLVACGDSGEETTVTGMVVSVEGTVISLVEMSGNRGDGQQGKRPEGMEGFDPENFDPENMPEGFQRPEGMENFDPENFDPENMPTMPEGMERPEGGERPEGMPERPEGDEQTEGSKRPQGGRGGNFEDFAANMETKDIDIAQAHISVEIDGGKASGTMDDIKVGSRVTVTLNGKGEATNVLVAQSAFGGMGGFGGFGGRGNRGNESESTQ